MALSLQTTDPERARNEFADLSAQRNATLHDVIQGGDGDPSTDDGPGGGSGGGSGDGSNNGASSTTSSSFVTWPLLATVSLFASWLL